MALTLYTDNKLKFRCDLNFIKIDKGIRSDRYNILSLLKVFKGEARVKN